MRKNSGFTMVETVVLLGVLMTSFMGLLAASQYNTQSFKELKTSQRASQYADEIKFALSDSNICKLNLQQISFPPDNPGKDMPPIYYYNSSGVQQALVVQVGSGAPEGLNVESMQLIPVSKLPDIPGIGAADLPTGHQVARFQINFSRDESLGAQSLVRSFPVDVYTTSNLITRCTTSIESSDFISEMNCDIAGGGNSYYDYNSKKCLPKQSLQVLGDAFYVQCPSGTTLPKTMGNDACTSTPPPGFVDAGPVVTRTYEGGVSTTTGPKPYKRTLTTANNSCACVYSTDIDPTGWACTLTCQTF